MATKRRTAGNRRNTRGHSSAGIPAWFWLLGGILIGLGLAGFLMFGGYLPQITQNTPSADSDVITPTGEALLNNDAKAKAPEEPRFDFFTNLPKMEVVIPEDELSRKARPTGQPITGSELDTYVLQTGSFRNPADAEQMKARLALLGSIANIQTVVVNGETWHRVRIGPFEGARKADEMLRFLDDNSIVALVLKVSP